MQCDNQPPLVEDFDFDFIAADDWIRIEQLFYRKIPLYDLKWGCGENGLDDCLIIPLSNAGPIAVIKHAHGKSSTSVYILNYLGKVYSRLVIPNFTRDDISNASWLSSETLVIISKDMRIILCDLNGHHTITPLSNAQHIDPSNTCIYGKGLIAVSKDRGSIIGIRDLSNISCCVPTVLKCFATDEIGVNFRIWDVGMPKSNFIRSKPILACESNKSLQLIDLQKSTTTEIAVGHFLRVQFSPNQELLAALISDMELVVVSITTFEVLTSYGIEDEIPKSIAWCGSDAVLLAFPSGKVSLVGPLSKKFTYFIEDVVCLKSEFDGARVFTKKKSFFIERVPECHVQTLGVGSIAPSSILYNCYYLYKKKQLDSLSGLFFLGSGLSDAINTCLEVALSDFSKKLQVEMFGAAYFGLSLLVNGNLSPILPAKKALNVINHVRGKSIGVPITYNQYISLTPERLVNRFASLGDYSLSLRICSFLGLEIKQLLTNWACMKVLVSLEESEICKILEEEASKPGFTLAYDTVALFAYNSGQKKSAVFILKFETPEKQASILLQMKEYELSLQKAGETFNPDIMYEVAMGVLKSVMVAEFFKMIRDIPVIKHVYLYYIKKPIDILSDFYYYEGNLKEFAKYLVCTYSNEETVSAKRDKLHQALDIYHKYGKNSPEAIATANELNLLNFHEDICEKHGKSFYSMSLTETVCALLILKDMELTEKAKKMFNISEERFLFLAIRSYVLTRNWKGLKELWLSPGFTIKKDDLCDAILLSCRKSALDEFTTFIEMELGISIEPKTYIRREGGVFNDMV